MMNKVALKFAASTLVLGITMVGCTSTTNMAGPAALSATAPKAEADAGKLYTRAQAAVQQGDMAGALTLAEQVVELAPRDSGYRMLLGDLYLKNGRFLSAETTFQDVLTLDPGNHRASLSIALAQIALGKKAEATAHLEQLALSAAPADVGLAFALAGQPQRAIGMLEPAARATDASGRVRQNLALAYALAGDWQRARTTAAQDVSPAELDARMQSWASFVQPAQSSDQVATMLGVTAAEDAGQPVRLALAPVADGTAYADAGVTEQLPPAPEPAGEMAFPYTPPSDTPVQMAQAASANTGQVYAASAPGEGIEIPLATEKQVLAEAEPTPEAVRSEAKFAEAVRTLVEQPEPVRASARIAEAPLPAFVPTSKAPRIAGAAEKKAQRRAGGTRFVVQIGAFKSHAQVERAWAQASRRYHFAGGREPLSTTVAVPGKGTLHRLSVSGFGTQFEAARLCGSIRAKGGVCFVRINAGDAPVQWASRSSRRV